MHFLKQHLPDTPWFLSIYFALSGLSFFFFQYLITPDAVAYAVAAQNFINGDWHYAITGGWPPLLTWLAIPLMLLGVSGVKALLIVLYLSGAALLLLVAFYTSYFEIKPVYRRIMIWLTMPLALYFPNYGMQPDLLMAVLFFAYLIVLQHPLYLRKWWLPVLAGFFGGLIYLSKSAGFPIWLLHFTGVLVMSWFWGEDKNDKARLIWCYLRGLATFLLISCIWIIPLSLKYQHLTTGLSSQYNLYLVGPHSLGHPGGHPMHRNGFLPPPPGQHSLSAWDDPANLIPYLEPWHPFGSQSELRHLMKLCKQNLVEIIKILHSMTVLAIPIFIIFFGQTIYLLFRPRKGLLTHYLIPAFTMFITMAVYLPLHVEERFLWLNYVFMLIVLGPLMTEFGLRIKNQRAMTIWFFIFAITFIGTPQNRLFHLDGVRKDITIFSQTLHKTPEIAGNIASNDHWHAMLYLSYYLNLRYFGEQKKGITETELKSELQKYNINYYFWWGEATPPAFLAAYPEVKNIETSQPVRIFKIH